MDLPLEPSADTLQQVCVIPYRERDGQLEYCLITSSRKGRWIFPKGIIDDGETYVESGLKEAFEEAGLRGEIEGPPCGQFLDAKWDKQLVVSVVPMRVARCESKYPESNSRQRRWVTCDEAYELLHRGELKKMLRSTDRKLRAELDSQQSDA